MMVSGSGSLYRTATGVNYNLIPLDNEQKLGVKNMVGMVKKAILLGIIK